MRETNFRREGGTELFVQFNDDPQAHQNVLLVLNLKEREGGSEGGREGVREGGREGVKEGGREGVKEGVVKGGRKRESE